MQYPPTRPQLRVGELACGESCDRVSSEYLVGGDITSHFLHTAINKMHSFSCDSSKRWLARSLLRLPCATEMLQIIFKFPATFEIVPFYPKEFCSFTRFLMPFSQQRLDPARIRSWRSLPPFPSLQQNCSSSFIHCCTHSLHSGLLLWCNPDVLRLVNLLTFCSKINLRGRLFDLTAPQSSAVNPWFLHAVQRL